MMEHAARCYRQALAESAEGKVNEIRRVNISVWMAPNAQGGAIAVHAAVKKNFEALPHALNWCLCGP